MSKAFAIAWRAKKYTIPGKGYRNWEGKKARVSIRVIPLIVNIPVDNWMMNCVNETSQLKR
jgi:hypothetical protein